MAAPPVEDPVLRPFLEAADGEAARERLGELLDGQAAPLVKAVVHGRLAGDVPLVQGQDHEDVQAMALLRLAEQLWALRAGASAPIADFAAYAAVTAHNACHAFLRRRRPERTRLRNRVRYVLGHHPELAVWEGPAREWIAGLAAWEGRPAADTAAQALLDVRGRLSPAAFPTLVQRVLHEAGGPCRVDDLVAALADVLGVHDSPPAGEPGESAAAAEERLPDPGPTPGEALEQWDDLVRLWGEIRLLPAHQRAALLLNLRDPEGRGMIGLFPLTGLASPAEIAEALEMPPARLDSLWEELPKDDEWIAGLLGVTRRQVINFRKCARERLARRLRSARA